MKPLATLCERSGLEKVFEGALGGDRRALHFLFWSPRGPLDGSERLRVLPRTVLSVFENVTKPLVFMLFFAMGPPLGRPGRQWGELLALQEGLIPL